VAPASGTFRLACLVIMWTLTVTAATIRLAWMSAPELAAGSTFVGLGWVAVLALPGVWTRGLPRFRLRRRGVPVRRDRAVSHQPGLTSAGHDTAGRADPGR
jgi:hypothetical protein